MVLIIFMLEFCPPAILNRVGDWVIVIPYSLHTLSAFANQGDSVIFYDHPHNRTLCADVCMLEVHHSVMLFLMLECAVSRLRVCNRVS